MAQNSDKFDSNKEEMLLNACDILTAGSDTSTYTMQWIIYLLSLYPEYQDIIYDELKQVTNNFNINNPLNFDLTLKLINTQSIIKEALRLYPPVSFFGRKTIQDDTWTCNQTNVTYSWPKDTEMYIIPYLLHRNTKYWGKDALKFDPSRFLSHRRGSQLHNTAWIPFGLGARQCVGFRVAMLEMKIVLSDLVRNFKWTLNEERMNNMKNRFDQNNPIHTFEFQLKPKHDIVVNIEKRN